MPTAFSSPSFVTCARRRSRKAGPFVLFAVLLVWAGPDGPWGPRAEASAQDAGMPAVARDAGAPAAMISGAESEAGPQVAGGWGGPDPYADYPQRWPGCYQRGLLVPGGWRPPPGARPDTGTAAGSGLETGAGTAPGAGAGAAPSAPPTANLGATAGVTIGAGAALPYLMGDAGFACGTLRVGNQIAAIGHPAWGCSRLNLAENGSPIPQNRVFVDYRHFHSVVPTDVFSVPQAGIDNSSLLDVDRVVFGFEKKFFHDLMSVEIRVPFNDQVTSDIEVSHQQSDWPPPTPDTYPNVSGVPITSERFQLGNVGLSWKAILYEDCVVTFTSGVGVKLPTAPDVTMRATVKDDHFRVYDPSFPAPGYVTVPMNIRMYAMVANESVDLVPFLAMAYKPSERLFAQGMLQVNIPVNPTRGVLGVEGSINGVPVGAFDDPTNGGIAGDAELSWQTLLRLNAQLGCWLHKNPGGLVTAVAALVEANWTTTLNDARTMQFDDIVPAVPGTFPNPLQLTLGNEANRVDIVNIGVGLEVEMRKWVISPGLVLPLTTGDNKPFDYEFDLRLNRRF